VIADRDDRKREPGALSRTCIVCSRRHSGTADHSPRLVRFPCLRVRQSGVPYLLPPRPPRVRLLPRLQQRQERCRPRHWPHRSLWPPGWGSRRQRFQTHSSCMPCRQHETGQSFCWCRAAPSRSDHLASWYRQRPARSPQVLPFLKEIACLSTCVGCGGWLGRNRLPAARALLHVRIVALRVSTVIPGIRGLGRCLGSLFALDILRRRGWIVYDRRRVVIRGVVIGRIVRPRVVVRTRVIPRHEPEWVDHNADAHIAMPAMPVITASPVINARSVIPAVATRRRCARSDIYTGLDMLARAGSTTYALCTGQASHAQSQQQNRPNSKRFHTSYLPI
jgi:hypothetical protein